MILFIKFTVYRLLYHMIWGKFFFAVLVTCSLSSRKQISKMEKKIDKIVSNLKSIESKLGRFGD